MKLNIKEIKYIRQSLEHRSIYYENKPQYEQFYNELKPIIKKFKKLEGLKGSSVIERNNKQAINLKTDSSVFLKKMA
jgi:murein L,D-transpeptidase YcbB/YkuD